MLGKVRAARASLEEDGTAIRITIPPRKARLMAILLASCLCFWVVGERNALQSRFGIRILGRVPLGPESPSLVPLWIVFWTIGGIAVAYAVVWMAVGTERISIDPARLIVEWKPIAFSPRREFDSTLVRRMRVMPAGRVAARVGVHLCAPRIGRIAFDYGRGGTFRFAGGMDEIEAFDIVTLVASRFPQMAA
jgi:hypothetical protein